MHRSETDASSELTEAMHKPPGKPPRPSIKGDLLAPLLLSCAPSVCIAASASASSMPSLSIASPSIISLCERVSGTSSDTAAAAATASAAEEDADDAGLSAAAALSAQAAAAKAETLTRLDEPQSAAVAPACKPTGLGAPWPSYSIEP